MNNTNETEDRIETRLKKLRPAPVSPALMKQLRQCKPQPQKQSRFHFFLNKGLLIVAAAVVICLMAVVLSLNQKTAHPKRVQADHRSRHLSAGRMTVKSSDRYLLGMREVGIWSAPDGRAYKVVQGVSMNQTVLQDSGNGSELKMIEPQQRVLLLAMATQ